MLGAVAIVALAGAILTIWIVAQAEAMVASGGVLFTDWIGYRDAVWRAIIGAPLYGPAQAAGSDQVLGSGGLGVAPTPGAIPWLIPVAGGTFGAVAWIAINVWFFVSGLFAALYRDLGLRAAIPFAFALLGCLPFTGALLTADVNLLLAGTFAWCWAVGRAEPRIGALAAVAGLFRLVPSVLVLWPTGRARWRSIAIAAVVVALSALVSLLLVGPQAWLDFASVIVGSQSSCVDGGTSITCILAPMIGAGVAQAVAIGIALVALAGALRVRNDRAAFVLFGLAMLAPVASSKPADWLIAYVAAIVLVGGVLQRADSRKLNPVAMPSSI